MYGKYNKVQNYRHKPPLRHAFDFWKLITGKVRNSGIERMARLESDRSVDSLERALMRLLKAILARSLIFIKREELDLCLTNPQQAC